MKSYNEKLQIFCQKKLSIDVLGIKCTVSEAKLLKEFFTQLGNPMDLDTCIGVFVPTGAVHMIGPEAYTNHLCDNNLFPQSNATIPLGDFQHTLLTSPICAMQTPISKQQCSTIQFPDQPWCLSLEHLTTKNKFCL